MAGQVSVRLAANVDAYIAAMRRAEASTTGFSRSTQRNMTRIGGQMQTLGRTMSIGVTLPVAALGVASTKMAMDFETSFAQMVGLANVPAEEVDHLKESVLALAGDTAQAPQDLADGLYLAASAGLDSAEALEVVEMAAMAAASGMGSTATVTDLLTSVLGSYGSENITAARATDILTAAVSEGKAAPDEMAQSLGAVLPIAASLGIEFEEVAGSVAFLTNAGFSAEEAVTALRGVMLAMIDPTAEADKALLAQGTSAAELKAAIDEGGLLGALELLREHGFAENSQALNQLFEDNKAVTGATALLEDQSGSLNGILDATANSTGAAGDAFSAVAETDAFKMQQALAELKVAMITIGEIILPIAAKVGSAIADMASFFSDLPGPVQNAILAFAGLAATAGPLIFIAGTLVRNFVAVRTALTLMSGPALLASTALLGITAALVIGAVAYAGFTQKSRAEAEATRNSTAALNTQFPALLAAAVAAARAGEEVDALAVANEALSSALAEGESDVLSVISRFNMSSEDLLDIITNVKAGGADLNQTFKDLAMSFGLNGQQAGQLVMTYNSMDLFQIADDAEVLAADIGITADELGFLTGGFFELEKAVESANIEDITRQFLDGRVAALGYEGSMVKAAEAAAEVTRLEDPVAVYRALTGVILEASDAELENAGITGEVAAEMAALSPVVDGAVDSLGEVAPAAFTGAEAMDILAESFENSRLAILRGGGFNEGATAIQEWGDLYSQALQDVTGPQQQFVRSQDAIWESALSFNEALDEGSTSLAVNSEAGLHNRGVLMDWMDAILAGADAELAAGVAVEDVNNGLAHNVEALRSAAYAAGLNKDEVDTLIDSYLNVPETVSTAIELTGEQYALNRIEELLGQMEEVDAGVIAEMEAILKTEGAWAAYDYLYDAINGARPTMNAQIRYPKIAVTTSADGRSVSVGTIGHAIAAQQGAYIRAVGSGGIGALLHSDEVVLPLGNQGRMAALLGLPEVGPRVAAAMTAWLPAGGGGGGALPPITIYNNGRDLTAADVARAIEMSRTAA